MTIPYKFEPRDYQLPFLQEMREGIKRAVLVWHRRAGKDKTVWNFLIKCAVSEIGIYYYIFPTYTQGKKILWDGMDKKKFPFLGHIPDELVESKNSQEMKIKLINGSLIQVIGSDNINSIVGTNPIGCVFSEYSLQDPQAWDFIRPILAENEGWAVFVFTPRGENHAFQLYQSAESSIDWFAQILTVDDTTAIPKHILDNEYAEIMSKDGHDSLYQQEYMCSFTAPIQGAYYAAQLNAAQEEGRITNVPYDPVIGVSTYWDLGVNDSTAIWFAQHVAQEIHLIDCYSNSGEGLPHYAKVLQNKGYVYKEHIFPHDLTGREVSTARSRESVVISLNLRPLRVIPKLSIEDGIEATRNILPKCWFDKDKCKDGLNALRSYHKEWDETNRIYKNRPCHDWSSHYADAFRMFALGSRRSDANVKVRSYKKRIVLNPLTGY